MNLAQTGMSSVVAYLDTGGPLTMTFGSVANGKQMFEELTMALIHFRNNGEIDHFVTHTSIGMAFLFLGHVISVDFIVHDAYRAQQIAAQNATNNAIFESKREYN